MLGAAGDMIITIRIIQTDVTHTHSKAFHHPLLKMLFRWVQWVVDIWGGGCVEGVDDMNNE